MGMKLYRSMFLARGRPCVLLAALAGLAWLPATAFAAKAKAKAKARRASAGHHARRSEPESGVSEKSSQRITAVIDTLRDILASVESNEAEEEHNFNAYMQWCRDQTSKIGQAIEQNTFENEQSTVDSKELQASIANLKHSLGEIATQTQEAKDTMDQAQNVRDEENGKYEEDMQMNRQSVKQIDSAIGIVGQVQSQGGFLQNGAMKRLQLNEPGESSYIFGIMRQLKERLEKTQKLLMNEEDGKASSHNGFMSLKSQQIASLLEEKSTKRQMETESKVELVEATKHAARTSKELQELQILLDQTKDQCTAKNSSFQVRVEDRKKEKAALHQAMDYLQETADASPAEGAGLLQQRGSNGDDEALDEGEEDASDGQEEEEDEEPELPPSFLQVRSRRRASEDGGSALLAAADLQLGSLAANGQSKEDFSAAKKVVTDLIVVLQKQQADEESKVKYCKAEIATKESEKAATEDDISTITAKIEYQQATRSTLENEVADLNKVIEEQKEELEEAKTVRESEKKTYEKGKKDRDLAVKVLNQAKQVLKGFYGTDDGTSLVQRGSGHTVDRRHAGHGKRASQGPDDVAGAGAAPGTWSGSSRKDVQGFNIIQVMDMLIGDITKEEKDASLQEADAAAEFERLEKDTKDNFDSMMQETTDRVKQKAKLVVNLNVEKESKSQKTNDLAAVNAQIESLHQECDDLIEHYDERTKARTFELSQLRDVVDILSGSSVAARTGGSLLESDSLSDREKTLLQDMSRAATGLASRSRSNRADS